MRLQIRRYVFMLIICIMVVLLMGCGKTEQSEQSSKTFKNPIVISPSADPWVIQAGDYYYYTYSHGRYIGIKKADSLQRIGEVGETVAWLAPTDKEYSEEIWAPELHYLNGKWYIYFAADNGKNENHRMYVLEGGSDPKNPLSGTFTFKGKISDPSDKWAIDGTVLQKGDGSLFFIWSGWEGDVDGKQNLYIAPMSNPWTISGERVLLSEPIYEWEKKDMPINEGPEVLMKNGKIFIIYSASGSWGINYCLGMLANTDGDVTKPSSWQKSASPVFAASVKNKTFGVGHCSFVKSPDGKEDWIVYHGMTDAIGWEHRSVRTQKFTWDKNGMPVFGIPVAVDVEIKEPSNK